jgi:hypothetical protein
MSANIRSARHAAVCGKKPGGVDQYYLKESCVSKKQEARAQADVRVRNATQRMARNEISKIGRFLPKIADILRKDSPKEISKNIDPIMLDLLVERMVRPTSVQAHPDLGERYQAACASVNRTRRTNSLLPRAEQRSVSLLLQVMISTRRFLKLALATFFKSIDR